MVQVSPMDVLERWDEARLDDYARRRSWTEKEGKMGKGKETGKG